MQLKLNPNSPYPKPNCVVGSELSSLAMSMLYKVTSEYCCIALSPKYFTCSLMSVCTHCSTKFYAHAAWDYIAQVNSLLTIQTRGCTNPIVDQN